MATLSSDVQVAIPGYAALLSFMLLAAQLVLKRWSASSSPGHAAEQVSSNYKTRKTYQVLRIVGCLSLLMLTALPLSCEHCGTKDEHVLAQCSSLRVLSLLTYVRAYCHLHAISDSSCRYTLRLLRSCLLLRLLFAGARSSRDTSILSC